MKLLLENLSISRGEGFVTYGEARKDEDNFSLLNFSNRNVINVTLTQEDILEISKIALKARQRLAETIAGFSEPVTQGINVTFNVAAPQDKPTEEVKPTRKPRAKKIEADMPVKPELNAGVWAKPAAEAILANVGKMKAITTDSDDFFGDLSDEKGEEEKPATLEDLRDAVQSFFTKNGAKTEDITAQKVKLSALFKQYGGSNVNTFPKDKIGEVLKKMRAL